MSIVHECFDDSLIDIRAQTNIQINIRFTIIQY